MISSISQLLNLPGTTDLNGDHKLDIVQPELRRSVDLTYSTHGARSLLVCVCSPLLGRSVSGEATRIG